tara:strand:- start:407 stop:1708 length:1302 start_codon:yes stop_codon:yes gene_type:complete
MIYLEEKILSLIIILLLAVPVFKSVKASNTLLNPLCMYFIFILFDILLPILIASEFFHVNTLDSGFSRNAILKSLIATFFGFSFFCIGYFFIINKNQEGNINTFKVELKIVYVVLIFFISLYAYILYTIISDFSSLLAWAEHSSHYRWAVGLSGQSGDEKKYLVELMPFCRIIIFVLIGVVCKNSKNINLKILFLVSIGFIISATSFFRGTILVFAIGLYNIYSSKTRIIGVDKKPGFDLKKLTFLLMPLFLFLLAGNVRSKLGSGFIGIDNNYSVIKELQANIAGHGLYGISMIISHYPDKIGYFSGKTIIDMLLLPIPRSIYTSKPEWYGIDDITRKMGLPESSQTAVTMPGELIANFGMIGLPIMILVGIFYGYAMINCNKNNVIFYIYSFWVFQSISIMNWMGFTGLINSIISLPPIALVLYPLLKKPK